MTKQELSNALYRVANWLFNLAMKLDPHTEEDFAEGGLPEWKECIFCGNQFDCLTDRCISAAHLRVKELEDELYFYRSVLEFDPAEAIPVESVEDVL